MLKKKKQKPETVARFILKSAIFLAVWIFILAAIALLYYFHDLPTLSDLETKNGQPTVQINYSNGERITNRSKVYSNEISFYELPPNLINAVIATEDRRFFEHHGIDIFGIIRAFRVNHESGRIVQGGSTITQQLAKLLFLKPERTIKRKIQEILLAVQLEHHFTKEQIFTLYLNRAYFGSGSYGIADAAKNYFNKPVSELSLNESAMLAGLLKAPSKFSPKNNQALAESRTNVVLDNMVKAGLVSEDNISELDQDLHYDSDRAQRFYFADLVYNQFWEFLPKDYSQEKIFKILTSLDQRIQEKLEKVLDNFINKNSSKLGKSELAVIIMKKDGALLGMAGGKDYQKSQFNRAVYAKRQAGSAFKTFVYLTAFENGFTPEDLLEDKKISIGAWLPENYNNHYFGTVSLEQAFANSLNSIAIQLAKKVGGKNIAKLARQAGIISPIDEKDPTIALGTNEVSLIDLTTGYATIANGGIPTMPFLISEIRNSEDQLLYKRQSSELDAIISDKAEKDILKVLRAAVQSGTAKEADIGRNIYGKTGTSQNFRDAWFIGFDDQYVIGIWIGNDDNSSTNKITGGSLPAILFAQIRKEI